MDKANRSVANDKDYVLHHEGLYSVPRILGDPDAADAHYARIPHDLKVSAKKLVVDFALCTGRYRKSR